MAAGELPQLKQIATLPIFADTAEFAPEPIRSGDEQGMRPLSLQPTEFDRFMEARPADPSSSSQIPRIPCNCRFFKLLWSHPPGSNWRPADYETILKAQLPENRERLRPPTAPFDGISALVEQVSEQVVGSASLALSRTHSKHAWFARLCQLLGQSSFGTRTEAFQTHLRSTCVHRRTERLLSQRTPEPGQEIAK